MEKFTDEQKEAMRQAVKEVADDAVKVAKKAKKAAKPVTDKVAQVAAEAAETAKPVTDKVAKAAEPYADAAKKAAQEAAKKVTLRPEIYVQYGEKEVLTADLSKKAREAYKAAGNRAAVRSLRIYVKPEDNAAYFVINDSFTGKIDL